MKKVENIVVGVGYPDSWRDYSALTISADNAYANQKNAGLAEYRHQIAKIGKPMDRERMVDAAAARQRGQFAGPERAQFPGRDPGAAVLRPKADAAFNYGAIGAVIGHEISHSFDNGGALFDSTGVMRNWWTPADFASSSSRRRARRPVSTTMRRSPGCT